MTLVYALLAGVILLVVHWRRGLKPAIGALLLLAAFYSILVIFITSRMP